MDEIPKCSGDDVLSSSSEMHVSNPRSYTMAANTNVAGLPSSPHVSRPSASMVFSRNAQGEHLSALQNITTNIPINADRNDDPTFNVGKVCPTQKLETTPPARSGPVRRVAHGKEDEAPYSITALLPRAVQPSVPITVHLPEYSNPEFPSKDSDDIHQCYHNRIRQVLPNHIPNRQSTTDKQLIDAPARSTPSLQFGNAEWKNPDVTEEYHKSASRPAIGCTDTVMDDYASKTAPYQDENSNETPDPIPRSIKMTTTEYSTYATAASTPTSTTQESSNAEDVTSTTNSIEAQGPGGRFWTPAEHRLVVAGRSKNESWDAIAEKLPGRTSEDCRRCIEEPKSRGMPGDGSHPHWTDEEENIMSELKRQGKKWTEIAEALPARSASGCHSRWRQKFEQKKEKKRPWWIVAHEARNQDRSRHGERQRRLRDMLRNSVESGSHRKPREEAGENSQRRASTIETAMHGHSSGSTVKSFPQRSPTSATEGRGAQGPYYQSPREGSLTARHVVQAPLIPPSPWSPSHLDYGIDPSSYGVQMNDLVPYPYYQTGHEQQSMTQITSPGPRRDLSRASTASPHSYELPRPHNDRVFDQRDSNLADDADVDMSSKTYDIGAHQRRRMPSIQSLCTPDGDSATSEYWSPGRGYISRPNENQQSAAFTGRKSSDFAKQA